MKTNKILKILKDKGLLTDVQIKEILDIQNKTGEKIISILYNQNYAPKKEILKALKEQTNIPYINLNKLEEYERVIKLYLKQENDQL
jgi:transcription initiation factor IIE alpha subunit